MNWLDPVLKEAAGIRQPSIRGSGSRALGLPKPLVRRRRRRASFEELSTRSPSTANPYYNDLSGSASRPRLNLKVHLLQVAAALSPPQPRATKWIKTAQQASSSGVGDCCGVGAARSGSDPGHSVFCGLKKLLEKEMIIIIITEISFNIKISFL